jgi:hypothetical protein
MSRSLEKRARRSRSGKTSTKRRRVALATSRGISPLWVETSAARARYLLELELPYPVNRASDRSLHPAHPDDRAPPRRFLSICERESIATAGSAAGSRRSSVPAWIVDHRSIPKALLSSAIPHGLFRKMFKD